MTKEELLKRIEKDPVPLSDEIREGSIPFKLLTKVIEENKDILPIIRISHLIHPDCDILVFGKHYFQLMTDTQLASREVILTKSRIFRYLWAIAHVMHCKDPSEETIKSMYPENKYFFEKLIKNPHITDEFKIIYCSVTGDTSHLPQDVQDCFVF